MSSKSVGKHLLSLATPESEIQWHKVSEVAESIGVSVDEVRNRLSSMNRSLLGYQVVVGEGEHHYDFSELETFRIYKYKS